MEKNYTKYVFLFLFLISGIINAQENKSSESKVNYKIGGYIKTDFIISTYNNGNVDKSSLLNDFYFPGLVPVGEKDKNSNSSFHVKQSRINLDISKNINGKKIRVFTEIDFMLSASGNDVVSNSYAPRLRHFFLEYNNFLVGQTWTTFMIVNLPDAIDFVGPTEGVVFARQPMVRYTTNSGWQFSLENSSTTYTDKMGVKKIGQVELIPDAVVRKNFKGDWGMFSVSTIFRDITFEENNVKYNKLGFGISTGGKFNIMENDNIKFSVSGGKGVGRYLALNFITSGIYNDANDTKFETIPMINGFFSYFHSWTDKLKSSASYSTLYSQNPNDSPGSVNKYAWSSSANLMYYPVDKLMVGVEFSHAYRQLENSVDGSFDRMQFSAKYSF